MHLQCLFVPQYAQILAFSALGRHRPSSSLFCHSASGVRTPSNQIELVRKIHHKNPLQKTRKIGRQHEDNSKKRSEKARTKTSGKTKINRPRLIHLSIFMQSSSYAKKWFEQLHPFYLHRAKNTEIRAKES